MPKAGLNKHLDLDKRKRIAEIINRMENYNCIYQIGKILANDETVKNDKSSYTINNNGFHIRVSRLSNETIEKLDKYLKVDYKKIIDSDNDIMKSQKGSIFENLTETSIDETNVRLSSKERKFFRKINNAI